MEQPRGKLKIYLGYAAGVGKTFQMLDDAQQMKRDGADVVIGYFEPHARKDTIAKTENLEMIPRQKVEYRGTSFEEMDTGAILSRHPQVCVVDEFPHTNTPGSPRGKRWEDVQVLLDAGIDVLTTMNIQHLESLNDKVFQITGIHVRETIPDWVTQQADQVVMVDVTPRALLNRLERGVVYGTDKAQRALENFFRESTLVALRELALRQTAHEVEVRQPHLDSSPSNSHATQHDKILIHLTDDPSTAMLIRRGKRMADYLQAECFAVTVQQDSDLGQLTNPRRMALEQHLNFARNLHIEARILEGVNVAETLVGFARMNAITQIFLARPQRHSFKSLINRDLVQQVVRLARDMQVIIVADRKPAK